jgi:hypothetical protein
MEVPTAAKIGSPREYRQEQQKQSSGHAGYTLKPANSSADNSSVESGIPLPSRNLTRMFCHMASFTIGDSL